jgi:hypothetical protein
MANDVAILSVEQEDYIGFEGLKEVNMNSTTLRDVTLCSLEEVWRWQAEWLAQLCSSKVRAKV